MHVSDARVQHAHARSVEGVRGLTLRIRTVRLNLVFNPRQLSLGVLRDTFRVDETNDGAADFAL